MLLRLQLCIVFAEFKFRKYLLVGSNILKKMTIAQDIISITKENPGGFSFAGPLHGCFDLTMKRP
jgi:hypothetical protein